MAQKTDLNVNPYYDDFDSSNNFYKVLFKPGYPVQARELTTLQSILQNQIEDFGSHIFKDGSVVIPGNIAYDGQFYAVKLNPTNAGIDVSVYINNFIGKKITGQTSGTTATIQYVAMPDGNNIEDLTIYVKYIDSDDNYEFNQFPDNESFFASENIVYGNTTIAAGTVFATAVESDATAVGSAAFIGDGVYFIRGFFVNVNKETLLLDEYSNTPSYRVGLKISEILVNAKDDNSLYDNAKGFTNYAAPGADRLKISLSLTKKLLSDKNDTDFVELLRLDDGKIKILETKTQYNKIRDYLAERTYDESGDYSIEPFQPSVHNSLNDRLGRLGGDGLFFSDELTDEGNTPSDDLMCVKLSPGKAYVRGYDVETISSKILDVEKPRDTRTIDSARIPFEMGNVLRVFDVSGTPRFRATISLLRTGGDTIGFARVYYLANTDATYTGDTTQYDLHLYDIQTFTALNANATLTSAQLPVGAYVKGKSSGASGYNITNMGGGAVSFNLQNTSGVFAPGEQLEINGVDEVPVVSGQGGTRSVASVTVFDTKDIMSVNQAADAGNGFPDAFSAQCVLHYTEIPSGTITGGNLYTPNGGAFSDLRINDIIAYYGTGGSVYHWNRITSVNGGGTSFGIAATSPGVAGVYNTGVVNGTYGPGWLKKAEPRIINEDKGFLYAALPDSNIESVDLSNSELYVRAQLTGQTIAGSQVTISSSDFTGISSAFLAPFDAERYTVSGGGGNIGTITSGSFNLNASSTSVTISGLTNSLSNVVVNATLIKNGIQSKVKQLTRSTSINVNFSKYRQSGTNANNSLNDGLTFSGLYGLRVQDEEISLNNPDVTNIVSVLESLDSALPTLDTIEFTATVDVDNNAVIGENFIGSESNAIARVVGKPSANNLSVVYLSPNKLSVNEEVTFSDSKIVTNIQGITLGSHKDITNSFILEKGQKDQYYDYSKIIRTQNSNVPSRRLTIIFDHYTVPTDDNGDVFTVLSYDKERYTNDIPLIGKNKVRATDVLDFRPRVPVFDVGSATLSPFDFSSRTFAADQPKLLLAARESSRLGYNYYLGRIDKIFVDKFGKFILQKGISGVNPKAPSKLDSVMEIGTINLPPYLYNMEDVTIDLVDNRRYTMRDIGGIEDRVENLERVTSLSLLELNTATLQIQDAEGNERFKSGFFVDDFRTTELIDSAFSSVEINPETQELSPIISKNTLKSQLAPATALIDTALDLSTNYELLDSNVQKTGNAVTLAYQESDWIEQPLATRVENVNPFHVVLYTGAVKLNPVQDTWVRVIRLRPRQTNVNINQWGFGPGGGGSTSNTSSRDVIVSSGADRFMRSRNTEYNITNIKPLTKFYQFFDGNGSVHTVPKLLEIATDSTLENYGASGSYTVGETVHGVDSSGRILIRFRVAKSNHKEGPFNAPTRVFNINPYVKSENLQASYSSSSKVLNVDTFALAEEAQGRYFGFVTKGMKLVGQSSGAVSYLKDLRLISDNYGDLKGTFFLENPYVSPAPAVKIETGTKTFRVTNSPTNAEPLPGSNLISSAETEYRAEGIFQVRQIVRTTTTVNRFVDPLAQSFTVGGNINSTSDPTGQNDDSNGAYLTAVDLFFANKDSNDNPVRVEIRTVELGTPTRVIVGETVTLRPDEITISRTGEIATKVTFPYPIFLEPSREYAVVIVSEASDEYELWCARMGEETVNTQSLPDAESVRYTKQFALGSLFKSQNGTIWTADQYQDLKFKLYKANFTSTSGTAYFYNPTLDESNGYVETLFENSVTTLAKTATLGITTTLDATTQTELVVGRKVVGSKDYVSGTIVGTGSSVTSVLVSNGGESYQADGNVETFNIIGRGTGLTLSIGADANGAVIGPAIVNAGNGYQKGDVVGIVTSTVVGLNVSVGNGAEIRINEIEGIDTLYLSSVKGNSFDVGTAVSFRNDVGTLVSLASTTIRSYTETGSNRTGEFIRVNHFDHGMYSDTNQVEIIDVASNVAPTTLSAVLGSQEVDQIAVADSTNFANFEGIPVSPTNPGFVLIENEIIAYDNVNVGVLEIAANGRGFESTLAIEHAAGQAVTKYELNGVSLRRINTTHNVSAIQMGLDSYNIQIDRTTNGVDRSADNDATSAPQLSFDDDSDLGGSQIKASENIQFSSVVPNYYIASPGSSTSASAKIRTVTGTSVDGSEVSFLDNGFENVELNKVNVLSSTRIVASRVNENARLNGLPRNKSFTTAVTLNTTDNNLSPIIYTDATYTEFRNSRVNNPITDYAGDGRVNSLLFDPNAGVYVSNVVNLAQPASSLKLIIAAYRDSTADIRALYSLVRADSSEVEQEFELFPGYDNTALNSEGDLVIVDSAKNSGRPDTFVPASLENQFLEYEFTANDLDLFTGYRIKLVLASTSQAHAPRIKDLRTIAVR